MCGEMDNYYFLARGDLLSREDEAKKTKKATSHNLQEWQRYIRRCAPRPNGRIGARGGGEGEEVRRTTADDDTRRDASGGEWVATLQLAALWVESLLRTPPLGTSATIPSEMAQTGREEGHERGVDSRIGDPPPRECARWRHCMVLDGGINSLVSTTTTKTTTRHTTTSK